MNSTEDMTPPAELSKGMANFRLHAFLQNDALTQRITSDLEQLNYAQILTSLALGSIENTDQSFPIQEQALDIAAEQSRGSGSHRARRRVKPSRKLLELQEINDGKPEKAFNMKYKTGAGVAKGPRGITGDGKVPVNEIWQDKNSDNKLKIAGKNNNYLVKRDALEGTKGKTDGIHIPGRILRKNKQRAAMKDGFKPVESVGNQICTEKTLRNDAGMQVENTNELGGNDDGGMEGNFSEGGSKEAMNDGSGSSDEKSRYKCEQCGKHFKTYYTFSIHIRMPEHTKETPFVCDICGKGFRLSSTLCRHKIIHTSNKPHQCSVCRKTFNRSSTLKMHMRTHSTRKQHVCGTCGKGFHQKGNLRNHMFVHSGERPFCCETCGRHFNKKSNLKHHLKIHEINGEFSCTICKKVFDEPGGLREHMQTRHCHL